MRHIWYNALEPHCGCHAQPAAYHTRLVQSHGLGRGELTGMLLMYPMCMVHVMEVSLPDVLLHVAKTCSSPVAVY